MEHPTLTTARLMLRTQRADDAAALLAYFALNAEYLQIWEPLRDAKFYTIEAQRSAIVRGLEDARNGLSARFIAFEPGADEIVASINLNMIRRGVNHAAIVGYSVGEKYAGRGYATEILNAIVAYAFEGLNLHRVETSYQPTNHTSGRVLEKAGFAIEGYARDYLFLNGAWRDGVLVSKRNSAWKNA